MSLSTAIPLPEAEIAAICRRHGVRELAVFGSVLTEDFRPDSDVDFLVTFQPEVSKPWMAEFTELADDLAELLGHPVDVVSRRGVEQGRNWLRKKIILESARTIYDAG